MNDKYNKETSIENLINFLKNFNFHYNVHSKSNVSSLANTPSIMFPL
jgi:hypothetical protein